jgi:hypothetical protein
MSTFGELRFRLSKLVPGIDLDLLDGWIMDRYQEILDMLPWSRLEAVVAIQSPDEYNTGTLTATAGSAAIVGSGTVWTAAMTGRIIRIANRPEYYQFTRLTDTTGTLDRAFDGVTAAALAYQINQNVYLLPSDARIVNGVTFQYGGRQLVRMSLGQLNEIAPNRTAYGEPLYWAPYMDAYTNPPVPQVELYPIPDGQWTFPVQFTADTAAADAATPSATVLPWVRPGALIAGVSADIYRHTEKFNAADRQELRFEKIVAQMVGAEVANRPPARIKLADRYTRHRVERWMD